MSYSPHFDWDKHRRNLNEQYKKWKSFQFTDYVFSKHIYVGNSIHSGGKITVKNNMSSCGSANTMDGIFEEHINSAIGKDANSWATYITYNWKYGYPESIVYDDTPEYAMVSVKIQCYLEQKDSNQNEVIENVDDQKDDLIDASQNNFEK
eukprot:427_1